MKGLFQVAGYAAVSVFAIVVIGRAADGPQAGVLDVATLGATANDNSDATPAVRAAVEKCRAGGVRKLVFPAGRYDFWPDRAEEKYVFVSNNDEGLKRFAFLLDGAHDLEIDGQGAQFVFHGYICAFLLERAKNITLKNFSIDYARTFHSEGRIVAAGDDRLEVEFAEAFPLKIERGILVFTGEGKDTYPSRNLLEFDAQRRETAFLARDYGIAPAIRAEKTGPRRVRIEVPKIKATPGNIMVFGAEHRLCPAFTISDSAAVRLQKVDLFHCGGMGVIAQRSADIELDHVRVTPPPNSGRIVSLSADATHFSNCAGRIVMSDCLFENQKDDATNIHGIYAQVTRQLAADQVEVRLVHAQQLGFDFIVPGAKLELLHGPSLVTYGESAVKAVRRLNKQYTHVTFAAPLPAELKVGDAVASVGAYPDVLIRRCTIRNNRARGLLLGSRGKIVIEDNLFHTPGAAILFEGDARYWFEQAGVRDCVVRRNRFDNCNFGVWGKACIEVGAGIEESCRAESRYNRNIVIEDNTFRVFDPRILRMYSVENVVFRRNRIEKTTDYPAQNADAKAFDIVHSSNVTIDEK